MSGSQDWRFHFLRNDDLQISEQQALDAERVFRALQKIAIMLNVDGKRADWLEETVRAVEDRIAFGATLSRRQCKGEMFHIFPLESVRSLCGKVRRDNTWENPASAIFDERDLNHCDICLSADAAHLKRNTR